MTGDPDPSGEGMGARLRSNIGVIEDRRRRETSGADIPTRVAHRIGAFAGSLLFAGLHAALFGLWAIVNWGLLPGIPRFDPSFVGLGTAASVEAIFLSTFVLISQNRLAEADEKRADLDLHINLLSEHELTRLAGLVERIAERIGVATDDPDFEEVKRDVEPTQVLDQLERARQAERTRR